MTNSKISRRARLGTALAALAISLGTVAATAPALAQASRNYRPSQQVQLTVGEGQMIKLPRSVADVWTSNPTVADVHVTNPRQINLFGKEFGEATVIATAADGSVVYGANVRVSQNLPSINELMRVAMPDANVRRPDHRAEPQSCRARSLLRTMPLWLARSHCASSIQASTSRKKARFARSASSTG